jgi:hypothetical protein
VTWSAEELRAGGWPEDDIAEYLAAVARTGERLAAMPYRPAPGNREPVLTETESRAQQLAALAVEQSSRRDAEKAAGRRAELLKQQTRITVTRPGDPPAPDERRQWALAEVMRKGVVIARPGEHNRPRQVAMRLGDEVRVFTAGALPEMVLIRPESADEQLRLWDWTARRREDEALIAAYGLAECQQAGILVTGATGAGEFARVELPPGVEAL